MVGALIARARVTGDNGATDEDSMAIPPNIKARLEQLKMEAALRAEADRRRAQAQQNLEQAARNPIPTKAKGGFVNEAHRNWFGESKAADPSGNPLTVYRGEHGPTDSGDLQTAIGNYTFTDDPAVASAYAENPNDTRMKAEQPRVVPAHLSIKNPIFTNLDDPFVEFSELAHKLGRGQAIKFARKHASSIENTNNWEENFADKFRSVEELLAKNPAAINQLYMDAYPLLDDLTFVQAAKKAGFDGAIHRGNGESMDALEYRVFDKKQVKSAIGNRGTYDPNEHDITKAKGGSVIKQLEEHLRDREGEYGLKRLQRAADEIPGLGDMYSYDALRSAFGGDNAQALMTMSPEDFEKFALRLGSEEDESAYEGGMSRAQYLAQLARIARTKGFNDVPFLEVNRRKPEYLPNIQGHEGRHRSRALASMKVPKALVRLFPNYGMREGMPRRYREDFIEAMKKELGEQRLVTPEGRSLLPADLTAMEHRNLENRGLLHANRPALPDIYAEGGKVEPSAEWKPHPENDLLQPIGSSKMVGEEKLLSDDGTFKHGVSMFPSHKKSYRYLYHDENQTPVGSMQIMTQGPRSKKAVIQNLYVAENNRRQGIATKLLHRARQDFDVKHSNDLTSMGRLFAKAVKAEGGSVQPSLDEMRLALTKHGTYSPLEKAMIAVPRTKGMPSEFMAEASKQPGYRAEEVADRRIALPQRKMTKAEMLEHLQKHPMPEIQQKIAGEIDQNQLEQRAYEIAYDEMREMALRSNPKAMENSYDKGLIQSSAFAQLEENEDEYLRRAADEIGQPETFHEEYSLPGGKNYREIMLKKPEFKKDKQIRLLEFDLNRASPEQRVEIMRKITALRDEKERHGEIFPGDPMHFGGEPGILAHMRVSDRTGPNGEKILHIEELQSDWHQEGRNSGYNKLTPRENQELKALLKKENEEDGLLQEDMERVRELEGRVGNIPDAPFKKSWHEMALKHALGMAVKGGYHGIAITPGEEQADRWSLSRHIDSIMLVPNPYPNKETHPYYFKAFDKTGNRVADDAVNEKKLQEYIGKEPAKQLLSTEPNPLGERMISGANIVTGGEGMKGFYDKIVPTFLNKLGKPHGAQVGKIPLGDLPPLPKNHDPEDVASRDKMAATQLHYFPITDSLRQQIQKEGLPQYERGGIIHKAEGGSMQPTIAQMKMQLGHWNNPIEARNIGINEAVNMDPKVYMPPNPGQGMPAPGGVATPSGMPVGGIDVNQMQPGKQLMPQPQQPQGGLSQPQGAPQGAQAPQGMPGAGGQPPMGPQSNILQMTPQGQTLSALGGGQQQPQKLAEGGQTKITKRMQTVKGAQRMAYPGIYGRPDEIAALAASRVAPEDPALKQLFGVTREDMYNLAKGRQGMAHLGMLPGGSANPRGAAAAEGVMTPRNEQRLLDVMGETEKHKGLVHGMDPWYYMDPLFERMVQLLGLQKATEEYKKMNALMGMASSASEVNTEIPRGSLAYWLQKQGRFNEFLEHGGKRSKERPADFGEVPGHLAHKTAHGMPMKKFIERGEVDMTSPKVPMYIEASGVPAIGFQTRTPVGDAHWSRAVGLADTRNPKFVKGEEVVPGASVTNPEMASLGPWWRNKIAAKLGLESVPAQARAWGAFSPQTGVTTPIGAPKLELIAKQIMQTAQRRGVSPQTARDLVLTGKERMGLKKGGKVDMDQMRLELTKGKK